MELRIIKLHNFLANLSVWVVYFKRKLEKTESYMSQTTYTKNLTLTFDRLLIKPNLRHNVLTKRDGAFILHVCIPCGKTFLLIPNFDPVTLTLTFDLLLKKKLSLGIYIWTERDRAFTLCMDIPCGKTFYAPRSNDWGHIVFVLSVCLSVCLLSTLTFAITFEP